MPHQIDAVAKLLPTRVGALFADMGTGKSRIAIEIARLRQERGKLDYVAWFCPVALRSTIAHEILKHTHCDPVAVHVFDDRTSVDNLPTWAMWHVIGIESLQASDRVTLAVNQLLTERTMAIVDESTFIKGNRAKRTQRITGLTRRCRYRLVMTGTPFTQNITDLYSQMAFLDTKVLGYASWYSFAANHVEYREKTERRGISKRQIKTGQIVRVFGHDVVAKRMAPYTYQISKDECLTLPDKLFYQHRFRPTPQQEITYQEAKERTLSRASSMEEYEGLLLSLFGHLQTIACGFVKYDGRLEPVPTTRLGELREVLNWIPAGEKIIVWAKYHYCIEEIVERFGLDDIALFHGKLSPEQRDRELRDWRAGKRILLATQAAGGHGLNLAEATHQIFYSNGYSYAERLQAEDHIHRIGQTKRPTYIDLICELPIEKRISEALSRKEDALVSFRDEIDRVRTDGIKASVVEFIRSL